MKPPKQEAAEMAAKYADPIRDALNRHGVFLKKAVLEKMPPSTGLAVHEEIGASFGGTRVADIVGIQEFPDGRRLYLIFECKRVAEDRRWIFYRHINRRFRVARQASVLTPASRFASERILCCSDGFEYPMRDKSDTPIADQDPVFKAASQLSAAFLGIVHDRWPNRPRMPSAGEFFVPVLVTTARLSIVINPFNAAPVTTGRLDSELVLEDVPELILKHPFPTPTGVEKDFRNKIADPWADRFTESLYIVRADHLPAFLDGDRREFFAGLL